MIASVLVGATAIFALLQNAQGDDILRRTPTLNENATATNTACALASKASVSALAKYPNDTVEIPAGLAYDCLQSVVNYRNPALKLLRSLRPWLEFESDLEYLADPPEGYLYPKVDFHATLNDIQDKVEDGSYHSEYDFQYDITSMIESAHDGHLAVPLDLAQQTFSFSRGYQNQLDSLLAAVSADGVDVPQIYMLSDLIQVNDDDTAYIPTTGYTPSPVVSINGDGVVSFLLKTSSVGNNQDPDTNWNTNFFTLGGTWGTTGYYFTSADYLSGPTTTLIFANQSTYTLTNTAAIYVDMEGVENEIDAWHAFCPNAVVTDAATATATSEPTATATTSTPVDPAQPTVFGYPWPAIKHPADMIAGYYLNGSDSSDVAVLNVVNFEPPDGQSGYNDNTYMEKFQEVLAKFLADSKTLGKKKLIIDLQQNGGGIIDLGTEFFAQLFPDQPPISKHNMRGSIGMQQVTEIGSMDIEAALKTKNRQDEIDVEATWVPLAYQTDVKIDMSAFQNYKDFYGPQEIHGGKFTNFFQTNYTDSRYTDYGGTGIVVSGTNGQKKVPQVFKAEDMIVLTDGACASTCTVVSEYLKSYGGVQFITIGGRPQSGPMQAIGGVKGSQIFTWDDFLYPTWQEWRAEVDKNDKFAAQIEDTIWANWTDVAWQRTVGGSVNGRNHFRIGDDSLTPLQYVYEAADCRIWYTREMLYDPVFLWERVAEIAFKDRDGKKFNSKYCVEGSTAHPTSIGGGWKVRSLGPQTPPENAFATTVGWNLTGKVVREATSGYGGATDGGDESGSDDGVVDTAALKSFKNACAGYKGNKWLVQMVCGALTG